MEEIPITRSAQGQRLDRFLKKYMPDASSGFLYKMLRKKNIKLNGGRAEGNVILKEGDRVQIYFSETTLAAMGVHKTKKTMPAAPDAALREQVRVLYGSRDILLLHKPAGMLTQRAKKEDDSLNDVLTDYCLARGCLTEADLKTFRPAAAHRLDRNTSGLVLCGITVAGLQTLSRLLKDRRLEKYYLALVKGEVKRDADLGGYLIKNERNNTVMVSETPEDGGQPARTRIHVLKAREEASLLKVELITGKSHQIRAHLAQLGHPILGDYKYGDRALNDRLKKECGLRSHLLHSFELLFPEFAAGKDPILGELSGRHFFDPAPEEFARVARKYKLPLQQEE